MQLHASSYEFKELKIKVLYFWFTVISFKSFWKFYSKICYDCIGRDLNNQEFNLSTMIRLILIASIGGLI